MTCGIFPFHDDWSYFTAPNMDFQWRQLLPGAAFWRPFDVMWGGLLAFCPAVFPFANRVAIALAHTLNAWMVWNALRILRRDNGSGDADSSCYPPMLGTLFFACSSAMAATLVNTDTINQTWSFFFGIVAFCVAIGNGMGMGRSLAVSLLLLLSLLFKESGVSWMAVIPLALLWKDGTFRRPLRYGAMFGALLVLYFSVRFALQGEVVLGDGQYYALAFDPESILGSILLSVIASLSGIDGLAFECGKMVLLAVTVVCSFGFWSLFAWCSMKHRDAMKSLVASIGIAVAMSLPHCFFKGHHPAEMHFYPVVFAGAFLLGALRCEKGGILVRAILPVAMAVLFSLGWYDKLGETYRHSERTQKLFREMAEKNIDFSRPVYFIVEVDQKTNYYSVFAGSAAHGIEFGKACRALNGWKEFDWHMAYTLEQIAAIPINAQMVWIK